MLVSHFSWIVETLKFLYFFWKNPLQNQQKVEKKTFRKYLKSAWSSSLEVFASTEIKFPLTAEWEKFQRSENTFSNCQVVYLFFSVLLWNPFQIYAWSSLHSIGEKIFFE